MRTVDTHLPRLGDELENQLEELHTASFAWTVACCGGDRGEAEDILQTAYLKIFDGRARFDGRSSLKTWLFSVIRRTAAGRRRQTWWRGALLQRRSVEVTQPASSTPEDEVGRSQSRALVRRALGVLSARQRQILELVFYHDLSIREAAVVVGISLGTARVHYERGKKVLAEHLEGEVLPTEVSYAP